MVRAYLAIALRGAIQSSGTVQTVTALISAALVAAVVFKLLPFDDATIRIAQDLGFVSALGLFLADLLLVFPYRAWLAERRRADGLKATLRDLQENPAGPIGIQIIDSEIGGVRGNQVTRIGTVIAPESSLNSRSEAATDVRIADLLKSGFVVSDRDFSGRTLVGPAVVIFGQCHFEHATFTTIPNLPGDLLWADAAGTVRPGTVFFERCTFRGSRFVNVAVAGAGDVQHLLRGARDQPERG